jgi:hypothetical protein
MLRIEYIRQIIDDDIRLPSTIYLFYGYDQAEKKNKTCNRYLRVRIVGIPTLDFVVWCESFVVVHAAHRSTGTKEQQTQLSAHLHRCNTPGN